MSDKKDEALKLALEALEELWGLGFRTIASKQQKAITAIREALVEQPAQQQAGFTFYDGNGNVVAHLDATAEIKMDYSKPSAWGNTAQQREPVSGIVLRDGTPTFVYDHHIRPTDERLYTSPPASKPWVGLMDEELELIASECRLYPRDFARAIEAKLREKNA